MNADTYAIKALFCMQAQALVTTNINREASVAHVEQQSSVIVHS